MYNNGVSGSFSAIKTPTEIQAGTLVLNPAASESQRFDDSLSGWSGGPFPEVKHIKNKEHHLVSPKPQLMCRSYTLDVGKVLHHSTLDSVGTPNTVNLVHRHPHHRHKRHGLTVWTIEPPRFPELVIEPAWVGQG
jgi:hypothetical protein